MYGTRAVGWAELTWNGISEGYCIYQTLGRSKMKFRTIREYALLDTSTFNMTSAFAYPETEKDGMYFWFHLLDRFGLVYVCTPRKERAPDAYFAYRSKLDGRVRRLLREGLEAGELDPALLDEGIALGIEFESKASYAKKHFETDGIEHISVICCNENDWKDAPVPVWSLQDHLGVLEESEAQETELLDPNALTGSEIAPFDNEEYRKICRSLTSDAQRLILMAFLIKGKPTKTGDELVLFAPSIKNIANQIAENNDLPEIRDIGGVLTAFTQAGFKKDIGLLRKGRVVRGDQHRPASMYYLPVRFVPYVRRIASDGPWELG